MSNLESLLARKNEIMKQSMQIDYEKYESGSISFDYEALMRDYSFDLSTIHTIQREHGAAGKIGRAHV